MRRKYSLDDKETKALEVMAETGVLENWRRNWGKKVEINYFWLCYNYTFRPNFLYSQMLRVLSYVSE